MRAWLRVLEPTPPMPGRPTPLRRLSGPRPSMSSLQTPPATILCSPSESVPKSIPVRVALLQWPEETHIFLLHRPYRDIRLHASATRYLSGRFISFEVMVAYRFAHGGKIRFRGHPQTPRSSSRVSRPPALSVSRGLRAASSVQDHASHHPCVTRDWSPPLPLWPERDASSLPPALTSLRRDSGARAL